MDGYSSRIVSKQAKMQEWFFKKREVRDDWDVLQLTG